MARAPRTQRSRPRPTRRQQRLSFAAIEIVGGLLTPNVFNQIAAPEGDAETRRGYGIPDGLELRDEIARAYRMAEAQWTGFDTARGSDSNLPRQFMPKFLASVFGFDDLVNVVPISLGERHFPIGHAARGGRTPVVIAPVAAEDLRRSGLDTLHADFADGNRRRSATLVLQEYLNAEDACLWGIATDGSTLRLLRDNLSLTRPAWIEVDLAKIFRDGLYADFSAVWLLIHASRFGSSEAAPSDCALEHWREQGQESGVAAREMLRHGVEAALQLLGQGAMSHPDNTGLREALASGNLTAQGLYEELLGAVYRIIFLFAAEDRDLLHPQGTTADQRSAYARGYSIGRLRERAMRRASWDRHHDAWDGLRAVFRALAAGAPALGLPALGGLFEAGRAPHLDGARIGNRFVMEAIIRVAWLRPPGQPLARVNWRDMETEELGSVYEGLLELVPEAVAETRSFSFRYTEGATGNERRSTGSYYTPDSLVKLVLDEALDPVLDQAEAKGGNDPAAEILELTIVDPACGSGHFLLGAARRAAARIANLRSDGAPSRDEFQHALREVVSSMIYGVDRNPLAVELCKVALWIEALEPGKPLAFLDGNIRCGDSLVGVFDLSVLSEGIPEDAYKKRVGDEAEGAKYYRDKNKRERSERSRVEGGLDLSTGQTELSEAFAELHGRPEDSLEDVEAKQRLFSELVGHGGTAWRLRVACDLWTAPWFVLKVEEPDRGREVIPTSGQLWEYLRGVTLYGPLVAEADRCAQAHRFFHWPIEFPDIMSSGGFDVVIGNPPWERVKLQEKEFFAARAPEIANAQNAAARKRLIEKLPEIDPNLAVEWDEAVRIVTSVSAFLRLSGRFPLGGVGDVNTFAVFADHFRQTITADGRAGLIVPNGLVTGFTYREFLGQLLSNRSLVSFYGFENEDLLFRAVHYSTKFGILTLTGSRHSVDKPWFTAHLRQPSQVVDPERRYSLSIDEIEAINPNTRNLPAFRRARDAEVTAAIYGAATVLMLKTEGGTVQNPWQVEMKTLYHMSGDATDFIDHEEIAPLIETRSGSMAVLENGRQIYPLLEGKMFWLFDHRYGTYENQTSAQANQGVLPRVSCEAHANPEYRVQPRYWVDAELTHGKLGDAVSNEWFFSWRDVGPSERTFVVTLLPRTAAGHKSPILTTSVSGALALSLMACLGSLVVDYAVRQKGTGMSFFLIEQSPVPHPNDLSFEFPWLDESTDIWLAERVLELCYTNHELAPICAELDRDHPPFRWQPGRRTILQAEIDAAVLHLYGLDRQQAEWLLDSFTVLRNYEERDHDEFRTKRLVLEIYDEMAVAQKEGRVFHSRLDPPAADPSCCHPA